MTPSSGTSPSSRLASATAAAGSAVVEDGATEGDELDARRGRLATDASALPPITIAGMTKSDDHHSARSRAFAKIAAPVSPSRRPKNT